MVKRRSYAVHTLQNLALGEAVLELRIQGTGIPEIAKTLRVTESEVRTSLGNAVINLHKQTIRKAEEYRALQDERLNRLLQGVWPRAVMGRGFAIDRALRIIDMQNKLYGLYAPRRIAALYADLSGAALDSALEQALEQLSARRDGKVIDGEFTESDSGPAELESGLDDLDGRSEEGLPESDVGETGSLSGSKLSP